MSIAAAAKPKPDPMTDLAHVTARRGPSPVTAAILALIIALLVVPVALIAIALGIGLLQLPYELALVLQRRPVAFPLHMVTSGLALILIPIAAWTRRLRGLHRPVGRAAAICVAAAVTSALLVALASEATAVARAGFFAQGVVCIALLAAAFGAIRGGDVSRHARLMIAMAAVMSGAIWLRLAMAGIVAAEAPFDAAYGAAAWGCWLVPLTLVLVVRARLAGP
ncbi:MAG TPA: DUF2306 domain-containing protein [Xanthobacteraceae bacterium]|nr:DUF2306 domain-containing protein [Xanthobacteraceae bacterium]